MNQSWKLDEHKFPSKGSIEDQIKFCLKYAILSPSILNSQPWKFKIVNEKKIEIYYDRTKKFEIIDPQSRELIISTAILISFLENILNYFGFKTNLVLGPNLSEFPDLIGIIEFKKEEITVEECTKSRFKAILERKTTRFRFLIDSIPQIVYKELVKCAESLINQNVEAYFIKEENSKNKLIEFILTADRVLMKNKEFRKEVAPWLHSNTSKSKDGIPAFAFIRQQNLISKFNSFFVKHFNLGFFWADHDKRMLVSGSPLLIVLATNEDNVETWIKLGYALGNFLLDIVANNLGYSFLNQPCLVQDLRTEMSSLIDMKIPQIILRVGFVGRQNPKHTPRKNIEEFLL